MWLERLKKLQDAPGTKVEKVEKGAFSTFSTSCPGAFPEKMDLSETVADEVRQAIPTASEQDLEHLHDRLTAAWNKGEVDRDTAETLTRLLLNRSRQLHQDTDELPVRTPRTKATAVPNNNTKRVYVSDLLAIPNDDGDLCHSCGRSEWWDNAGQRTCGVCHPKMASNPKTLKGGEAVARA